MNFFAPSAAGQYEFRYYLNDTYALATMSNSFTVSASPSPTPTPAPSPTPPSGNAIAVNNAIVYQTMTGWEATATIGDTDCVPPNMAPGCPAAFTQWRNAALDAAAELGINRVRVTIQIGIENPRDWHADWVAGLVTHQQKNQGMMQLINDNTDSNAINPNGFKWGSLDFKIDNVVLPLKQRLQARGEQLYVNFQYDGQGSAQQHRDNPAEYAEFTLAVFQHMQSRYGFVPNSWEIMNEPDDNTGWTGDHIGQVLAAVGPRLAAAGFTPRFVGPSTASAFETYFWLNDIVAVPGAQQWLNEVSYHRYQDISNPDLANSRARVRELGMDSGMLERIGATYSTLHDDLSVGENSAWQQYTLAYPSPDDGSHYFVVLNPASPNPIIDMATRTKFLRQYFKYIRAGAVRIGAQTGNSNFDPVAFRNSDGRQVVVVNAETGGSFTVHNLPAGTYGMFYTTGDCVVTNGVCNVTAYNVNLPDQTITGGQPISTGIPAAGVITIYRK
jgi:Glycosyl hydrolase family 30 beta sandwich domain